MFQITPYCLFSNVCKQLQWYILYLLKCFCILGCLCGTMTGQLLAQCPLLTVDIGSTSLQICSDNQYFVYYCNQGDAIAENVQIGVEFPETITFKEAELPAERIENVYFFEIGALEVGQCGEFAINVSVACDVLVGKTACVEANITPNKPCDPPSELWDRANVEVLGECVDGQIKFTVSNTGEGNMAESSQYRIYEDDIFVSSGTKFQLATGESFEVFRPVTGQTVSLVGEQSLYHPQRDTPKATVEACGTPPFSLGIINKFPQNDQLPFRDFDCQQIETTSIGTEKLLSPSGARAEKIVSGKAQLTYKIRFQNDEGMAIDRLVIRDVLSPYLDISSLQLGASSHDYTFEFKNSNVLEWTFENINLPSSEENLRGSQGFVQFKIHVLDEALLDIQIDNHASMRIGDNPPVFTNTVYHFTGDLTLNLDFPNVDFTDQPVKVYPIPAQDDLHFVYDGFRPYLNNANWRIDIYNLMGTKIASDSFNKKHIRLNVSDLIEGMYMYRIQNQRGSLVQSGKIYIN